MHRDRKERKKGKLKKKNNRKGKKEEKKNTQGTQKRSASLYKKILN